MPSKSTPKPAPKPAPKRAKKAKKRPAAVRAVKNPDNYIPLIRRRRLTAIEQRIYNHLPTIRAAAYASEHEKQVAVRANIPPNTLRYWLKKGKEQAETGKIVDAYGELAETYHNAIARGDAELEKTVFSAAIGHPDANGNPTAPPDIKAAQWLLAKRMPHKYGDAVTVKNDAAQEDAEIEAALAAAHNAFKTPPKKHNPKSQQQDQPADKSVSGSILRGENPLCDNHPSDEDDT